MNLSEMKLIMEEKGYSYAKLSELTRISEDRLRKIFEEEVFPNYGEILKLERALNPAMKTLYVSEPEPAYYVKKKYTLKDYYALPDQVRAELIDGQFYFMASPTSEHQIVSKSISFCIEDYLRKNKGTCKVFCAPMDVQLDCDEYTMMQPDILIVCDRDKIKKHIVGAPDLIIEILSPGTKKHDMTIKLRKYRRAGVREYWMVDLEKECVMTYFFEESENPVIYTQEYTVTHISGEVGGLCSAGDGSVAKVPVKIYDGNLKIDFEEIFAEMREFQ